MKTTKDETQANANVQLELKLGDERIAIDESVRWYCQVPRGWQKLSNADKILLYGLAYIQAISEADKDRFVNIQSDRLAPLIGLKGSFKSNNHKIRSAVRRIETAGLCELISDNRGAPKQFRLNLQNGFVQAPLLPPGLLDTRHSIIAALAILETVSSNNRNKVWTRKETYHQIQEIAENAGVAVSSLYRWLDDLDKAGVLKRCHHTHYGDGFRLDYWLWATRFNGSDLQIAELEYRKKLGFKELVDFVRRRPTRYKTVDKAPNKGRSKGRDNENPSIYINTEHSLVDTFSKPKPSSTKIVVGSDSEKKTAFQVLEQSELFNSDKQSVSKLGGWIAKQTNPISVNQLAASLDAVDRSSLETSRDPLACVLWRFDNPETQSSQPEKVATKSDESGAWQQFLNSYKEAKRLGVLVTFDDPILQNVWNSSPALRQALKCLSEFESRKVFWESYRASTREEILS